MVRQCFMQLRDIAMSGYDVWGERMLGRRRKCSFFLFKDMIV